jgi:cell pole-organizing protein PopZ
MPRKGPPHPGLLPDPEEPEPLPADSLDAEIEFREVLLQDEPPPTPAVPPRRPAPPPEPEMEPAEDLISEHSGAAVATAFNSLATTILNQNARTLEDLVKELLRPMLKSWLDQNLPPMVERMIRAEIERVTRGRP